MIVMQLVVVASVALMGFAIQRGATCTVAAVDELMTQRRAHRLQAMLEASLWVAGGLVLVHALGALPAMPAGFEAGGRTVAGGVLLGLGAWLNGACVFGAIARLGSGQWAWAATPLGYYLGCVGVAALPGLAPATPLATPSPLFVAPQAAAVAFALFAGWRLAGLVVTGLRVPGRGALWTPHAATLVIGVTFLVTLLLSGPWAYTELLADLARTMAADVGWRVALFAALLSGAAWGGWRAGRWRPTRPSAARLLQCAAGGALMGSGTLLIPGSNDGLILLGLPLLRPYAWLAFATMCLTIAAAQALRRRSSLFHHAGAHGDGAA
jgi:toxin CptA